MEGTTVAVSVVAVDPTWRDGIAGAGIRIAARNSGPVVGHGPYRATIAAALIAGNLDTTVKTALTAAGMDAAAMAGGAVVDQLFANTQAAGALVHAAAHAAAAVVPDDAEVHAAVAAGPEAAAFAAGMVLEQTINAHHGLIGCGHVHRTTHVRSVQIERADDRQIDSI